MARQHTSIRDDHINPERSLTFEQEEKTREEEFMQYFGGFEGNVLLHVASTDLTKVATYLIEKEGRDVNARDEFGITPLHMAMFCGGAVMVDTLLKMGAKPSLYSKDCNGDTPYDIGIKYQEYAKLSLLLEHGKVKNR